MKKKEWKKRCKILIQQADHDYVEFANTIADKHIQCGEMADRLAEFRDAAEFEALVAKKLARHGPFFLHCDSRCPWYKQDTKDTYSCIHEYSFGFCRLRDARIEVEEEME